MEDLGARTLNLMTFCITTHSIMTFYIVTLIVATFCVGRLIATVKNDARYTCKRHSLIAERCVLIDMLSVVLLNVMMVIGVLILPPGLQTTIMIILRFDLEMPH